MEYFLRKILRREIGGGGDSIICLSRKNLRGEIAGKQGSRFSRENYREEGGSRGRKAEEGIFQGSSKRLYRFRSC